MRCGLVWSLCCPIGRLVVVVAGAIIARSWRRSSGASGRGLRGGTYRRDSLRGKRSGGASTGGPRTARGTGCWPSCRARPRPRARWSGWYRWTRRSLGPTSTLRARPAPFGGARANYTLRWPEPDDHALGHSRGGWTTKAHATVDARGRPLAVRLTPGQAGDNPELLAVLNDIAVPTGRRPRSRPDAVIADKAYSHPSTRQALRRKGIRVVIPQRRDQVEHRIARGNRGGRPPRIRRRRLPRTQRHRTRLRPHEAMARHRHPL